MVALQRCESLRAIFMAEILLYNREQFVWIDETGCNARNYRRKFGYSLRGTRAECNSLLVRGSRISSTTLHCDGVKTTTETVNADIFYDFVRGEIIPNMNQFDGCSTRSVVIMFTTAGILLLWLPPYSPDLNPIEEAFFNSVKAYLRAHDDTLQLSSVDRLPIIHAVFQSITQQKCNGWISHSGYV